MNIKIITKYALMPFLSFINLVIAVCLWIYVSTRVFKWFLKLSDEGLYFLLGKWGILISSIIFNVIWISFFLLIISPFSKLFIKFSPNKKFTKYSYIISAVLIILYLTIDIFNLASDFYSIIQSISIIIFIVFVCVGVILSVIDE